MTLPSKERPKLVGCIKCHERLAHVRGLCWGCYEWYRTRIKKGILTWQQLEGEGKCLVASPLHQQFQSRRVSKNQEGSDNKESV